MGNAEWSSARYITRWSQVQSMGQGCVFLGLPFPRETCERKKWHGDEDLNEE